MNPLLALQDNLAALIAAHPYFKGAEILTEKLADLDAQIEKSILNATGFGVVITTARGRRLGDPDKTETTPLVTVEELAVTIIHAPLLDAAGHNALDAVAAAIAAIDCKPSTNPLLPWRVLGHEYIAADRDGLVTHTVRASAKCLFDTAP